MKSYIIFLLGILCISSCYRRNSNNVLIIEDIENNRIIKQIETDTGIDMPENCSVVHYFESDDLIDPYWLAKIQIPVSCFEAIAKQIESITPAKVDIDEEYTKSIPWWNPTPIMMDTRFYIDDQTLIGITFSKKENECYLYYKYILF